MLTLEIGKTYCDGNGMPVHIMGPTRDHPEWVWSNTGHWYVKATGERLTYYKDGTHAVTPRTSDHLTRVW